MPRSLRVKPLVPTSDGRCIAQRAGWECLSTRVQHCYGKLKNLETDIFQKQQLDFALGSQTSAVLEVYKEKAQTKITSNTKERHKRKFDKLLTEQSHPQSYGSRKVGNLSTKQLDDTSWLSPRVLILPLHLRRSQLLILSPSLKLQSEGWGSVRQTVAAKTRISIIGAVSRTRMPPRNVPPKKMKALKNLACDEDILILPADKCKATMAMNKADYDAKMLTMLRDKNTYCPVKKDPTSPLVRNMNSMIVIAALFSFIFIYVLLITLY